MARGLGLIVDITRQQIQSLGQETIGDFMPGKENGIVQFRRIVFREHGRLAIEGDEQPAVVYRHIQRRVAVIHRAEEMRQRSAAGRRNLAE